MFLRVYLACLFLIARPAYSGCIDELDPNGAQLWNTASARLNIETGHGFAVFPTKKFFPEEWARQLFDSLDVGNAFIDLFDGRIDEQRLEPQLEKSPELTKYVRPELLKGLNSRLKQVLALLRKRAQIIDPTIRDLKIVDHQQLRVIRRSLLTPELLAHPKNYRIFGVTNRHTDGGWLRITITLLGDGTLYYDKSGAEHETPRGDMLVFSGIVRNGLKSATPHAGRIGLEDRMVIVLTLGPVRE